LRVAILSINSPSFSSALKLAKKMRDFDVTLFAKDGFASDDFLVQNYKKLDDILPTLWREFDAIVAILAVGAVVRKIAPFLEDKAKDPAVLVINLALDKIVPLVGGHLAGANQLSETLAKRLNAINFISTATDQTGIISFDTLAQKSNWRLENLKKLAKISNRLLNGQRVKVSTRDSLVEYIKGFDKKALLDFVSLDKVDSNSVVILPAGSFNNLTLRPKISIGIGCNKGVDSDLIYQAFIKFCQKNSFSLEDIESFYSFDAKKDERGILDFVKRLDKRVEFFTKEQINSLPNHFSDSASKKFFGLKGVAEPSAVLGSKFGDLVAKKEAFFSQITLAGAI